LFEKVAREALKNNGCSFVRRGKATMTHGKAEQNFSCRWKNQVAPNARLRRRKRCDIMQII
jgi:hypothetical protein